MDRRGDGDDDDDQPSQYPLPPPSPPSDEDNPAGVAIPTPTIRSLQGDDDDYDGNDSENPLFVHTSALLEQVKRQLISAKEWTDRNSATAREWTTSTASRVRTSLADNSRVQSVRESARRGYDGASSAATRRARLVRDWTGRQTEAVRGAAAQQFASVRALVESVADAARSSLQEIGGSPLVEEEERDVLIAGGDEDTVDDGDEEEDWVLLPDQKLPPSVKGESTDRYATAVPWEGIAVAAGFAFVFAGASFFTTTSQVTNLAALTLLLLSPLLYRQKVQLLGGIVGVVDNNDKSLETARRWQLRYRSKVRRCTRQNPILRQTVDQLETHLKR